MELDLGIYYCNYLNIINMILLFVNISIIYSSSESLPSIITYILFIIFEFVYRVLIESKQYLKYSAFS
jgi:hypothetical protein